MKKFFTFLLIVLLIGTASSCANEHKVVGDEYVVASVKYYPHYYGTKYYVEAFPVNKKAHRHTFWGNKIKYYTNTFYSVGDTIKLSNRNQPK